MRVLFTIATFIFHSCFSFVMAQSSDMDKNQGDFLVENDNSDTVFPHTINYYPNLYAFLQTGKSEGLIPNVKKLAKLRRFIENITLKKRRFKNESQFLSHVFYKTHEKFLKTYTAHATVTDIFSKGEYDCVSGTALYAILLDQLNIDYTIKEFDYHVLLLINADKTYMIESTDPLHGFVEHKKEIHSRISDYANEAEKSVKLAKIGSEKSEKQHPESINNDINLKQLLGLQYFNNAVYFYNKEMPVETITSLKHSLRYYNSKRIRAFKVHTFKVFANNSAVAYLQR